MSGRVSLDKIRIWIGRLAECPPKRRWPSFNPLRDWLEQEKQREGEFALWLLDWEHWSSPALGLGPTPAAPWVLRSWTQARSMPSDLVVSLLQMVGCGTSQPPQSLKSIPYDMAPFRVCGEPWPILHVHQGTGQLQAMENMTLVTWVHKVNLVKYLKTCGGSRSMSPPTD